MDLTESYKTLKEGLGPFVRRERERETYAPAGLEEANCRVVSAYKEGHGSGSCGKPPGPAGGCRPQSLVSQSPHPIATGEYILPTT